VSDNGKLREYRIRFEPVPPGQRAIAPSAEGLRSKLGGEPDWVQGDERPDCPACGGRMMFELAPAPEFVRLFRAVVLDAYRTRHDDARRQRSTAMPTCATATD
jgi:hypothetical protein